MPFRLYITAHLPSVRFFQSNTYYHPDTCYYFLCMRSAKPYKGRYFFALFGLFLISSSVIFSPFQFGMDDGSLKIQTLNVQAQTSYVYNKCVGINDSTQLIGYYRGPSACTAAGGRVTGNGNEDYVCTSEQSPFTSPPSGCTSRASLVAAEAAGKNPYSCNSFSTCVADLVYVVTVGPTSIFAYIGSLFLSVGVKLSLTSTAYALQFLTTGWTVARDVANIAFLFILIFIAITIILKADSSGTTQTLAFVIVMALLVNFSFFLTRVVIDAGNI